MKNREAFAGIDVAIAKRKRLPVVVCVREEDTSPPRLYVLQRRASLPYGRQGNIKTLLMRYLGQNNTFCPITLFLMILTRRFSFLFILISFQRLECRF